MPALDDPTSQRHGKSRRINTDCIEKTGRLVTRYLYKNTTKNTIGLSVF